MASARSFWRMHSSIQMFMMHFEVRVVGFAHKFTSKFSMWVQVLSPAPVWKNCRGVRRGDVDPLTMLSFQRLQYFCFLKSLSVRGLLQSTISTAPIIFPEPLGIRPIRPRILPPLFRISQVLVPCRIFSSQFSRIISALVISFLYRHSVHLSKSEI